MEYKEVYWAVVSYIYIMTYFLITARCFSCFVNPFMEKKGGLKIEITYFCVMVFLHFVPFVIENFVAYGIGTLAVFAVMCVTDRRNYEQKIFLAVTFYALRGMAAAMAIMIESSISERINKKISAASMGVHFWVFFGTTVFLALLQYAVIRYVISLVLKVYKNKRENMTKKETVMLIMPSFLAIAGNEIRKNYETVWESLMLGENPFVVWKFIYYSFFLVTIVVIIVLFQKIKEGQQETLQNEILSMQLEHTREHIAQVENLYRDIRSLKHDMANHIVTLEKLCQMEENEAARVYMENIKEKYSNAAGALQTGHPVMDVILQEKSREAREKGIRFFCDFHYPANTNLNAFDVSIILNNGLQNSFEAVSAPHASVSVCSYRKNNVFMIEISNSFSGTLSWDRESGLPITTKEGMGEHGYGLLNIQKVAQKYFGDIDVICEDGKFILTVMLLVG